MPQCGDRTPDDRDDTGSQATEAPSTWFDYLRAIGEILWGCIRTVVAIVAWPAAITLLVRDYRNVRACLARLHIGWLVCGGGVCLFLAGLAAGGDHWWVFGSLTAIYLLLGIYLWVLILFSAFCEPNL